MVRNNLNCQKPYFLGNPNKSLRIPKKLQYILNLIVDPAVIVDVEGSLIAVNDKLVETTGFRTDELLGKKLLVTDFVASKSRICLMKKCLEIVEKNQIEIFEIELNKKNGEKIFVEVKTKKIDCAEKVVELLVFHDVTDRRVREAILKESEERYVAICEDARILMLDSDLKGNIYYANKIAENYGLSQKDVIGKNLLEFVGKKIRAKLVLAHLSVVSGKKIEEEIEIITSKGVFTVDYVSSPIRKEGKIIGCRIIMIDITDKKQVERKLEKYADSAFALNEAYRNSFGH